jgi:hypothetical protein
VLSEAAQHTDWASWAASLQKRGLPMAFASGKGNESALQAELRKVVASLAPGQTAPITFVQGRLYLVRVVAMEPVPPHPFEQVQAEIRHTLEPTQVKASLESARKAVLPKTRIEYVR